MDEDRRSLLGKLVWLGSALFGALASVPLVGSLVDPVVRGGRRARGKFVRAARLDALEPGVPRKVAIVGEVTDAWNRSPRRRLGAVWLVRGRGDEVTAFSVVCPHLGCGIDYRESDRSFRCPCHDSAFSIDGARTAGPSPRPMDSLETSVRGGDVLVRFAKFRQGTGRKIEKA